MQRETYVGQWLPEPLVDENAGNPAESAQLADSPSLAFLMLLETLNPVERAVFILREGFDCDFADIGPGRGKVRGELPPNPHPRAPAPRRPAIARRGRTAGRGESRRALVAALRNGDLPAMLAHLAQNVVLVADGGAKPGALLRPLHGANPVAQAMLHATRKHPFEPAEVRAARINGLPGFVRFERGEPAAVLAFGVADGRIDAVFVITNPAKLRHLRRQKPSHRDGNSRARRLRPASPDITRDNRPPSAEPFGYRDDPIRGCDSKRRTPRPLCGSVRFAFLRCPLSNTACAYAGCSKNTPHTTNAP